MAERDTRPSVGAIIPAHNAESFVRDAVESVLAQSRPVVDYFLEVAAVSGDAKVAANWVTQDVLRTLESLRSDEGEDRS